MKKKILNIIIVLLLIISNLVWGFLYFREKNNLRHSIIPITQNDYYQTQLALVENYNILYSGVTELPAFEQSIYLHKIYTSSLVVSKDLLVPFISQLPNYPNGCESVSAVMLLQSYGIDITVDEFVNKYLKKDKIYSIEGERYGPDPSTTYAGDPASLTNGFGVFEPGIKLAIEKVLNDKLEKGKSFSVYGSDTKAPLIYYVSSNVPIVIWATTNYDPVNEMWTWKSYNKQCSYTYPKNSHTIVVTGMDENFYYVNDPLQEHGNVKVEKEKLEKSFDSLGRQVVGLSLYDLSDFENRQELPE